MTRTSVVSIKKIAGHSYMTILVHDKTRVCVTHEYLGTLYDKKFTCHTDAEADFDRLRDWYKEAKVE
jgi:2-C-methyl-D-erythritol 4-phosphate cytidylyltransferase